MKINIKATGIELTPEITEYVEKKISTIEKYLEGKDDVVVQVEVGRTTNHHRTGDVFKAEAHIAGGGLDLYAVSEQTELHAALDVLKDEIVRNLTHLKGKKETLTRRGARAVKDMIRGFNPFKRRG